MVLRFATALAVAGVLGAPGVALAATIISQTYEMVATVPLKQAFGTSRNWRAEAAEPRMRPDEPAQLCFLVESGDQACTNIVSQTENGAPAINYSKVKRLAVVSIAPRQRAVVLDALFPNDLRMAIQTSLWTYDRENDTFAPVLTFALTEIGTYRIFPDGPLAEHVLTAEFVPGENEDRYGGHRFTVTAYHWMAGGMGYVRVLSYVTPERFKGETEEADDLIEGDIFTHEMPRIRALMKQVYPEMKPRIPPPQ